MSGAQITALGKYAIRGVLGKGAMGIVYDGWDPVIDRRVAIKTVRLPDTQDEEAAEGLARFKREAQAAGRLTHPNIVGVFDYGETEDLAYIVMEFVEGRSLKDVMAANERMTTANAIALMDDILAGLAFSHGRGVVHRDVKPANIMITADGRAKIADFGIARIEASSMTQAGTVLGTPAYMSPEQFMGQVVDRRTDIYSSGVLLYQLLTGDRPFEGSMTAIMHKVLTTVPPRPSELVVTSPVALDAVVAKAMARRPEDRYDTAAEFGQALHAPAADVFASDETIVAAPRTASPPLPPPAAATAPPAVSAVVRPSPRGKLPVFVGGGVALIAIAAAIVWFLLPAPSPVVPPQQQASAAPPAAGQSSALPNSAPSSAALAPPAPVTPAPAPVQPAPVLQASNPPASAAVAPPPQPTPRPVQPPAVAPTVTAPAPAAPFAVTASTPLPTTVSPPVPVPPSVSPASSPFTVTDAASPSALASSQPVPTSVTPPASATPTPAPAPVQQQQFASATLPAVPAPEPQHSAPVRSAGAIENALANSLPQVKCSLAHAAVAGDGTVTVTGVTGGGQAEDALRRTVAAADPAGLNWQVQRFDGPYCAALDVLRPVAENVGRDRNGMEMGQVGGPTSLKDNDVIALQVTMPGFAGFLHVAYLQHDATVSPQVPGPGYPSQTYAARAQVEFGTPRQDFEGWHVGPPFGTDMIVAVASTAPLFTRALPDSQPLAAYLASLQTAMETLRRRGGSVAAAAIVLDTRPGR